MNKHEHPIKLEQYSFLEKVINDREGNSVAYSILINENTQSFLEDIIKRSNAFDELIIFAQYVRDSTIDDGCRKLAQQMIEKHTRLRTL